MVPRQRIIDAVWHTLFVSENVVGQAVTELRQALGDSAGSPQYIQNVPRRGYRLVARVAWLDSNPSPEHGQSVFTPASAYAAHSIGRGEYLVGPGARAPFNRYTSRGLFSKAWNLPHDVVGVACQPRARLRSTP